MLGSKVWRWFSWVYFIICSADILALNISIESYDLHMIFKPLIMPTIIYFLIRFLSRRKFYKLILIAFVFSWLGDILLLGQSIGELFFVGGLSAFLIAHILYIFYFKKSSSIKSVKHQGIYFLQIATVFIAVSFYLLMFTSLGELWVPVLIYVAAIGLMGVTALERYGRVNMDAFSYTVIGAFVFILSDSIIGYDKFVASIPFAQSLIMTFYCYAQFMILKGFVALGDRKEDIEIDY